VLHDLFGSPALLRLAGAGVLDDAEVAALHRPRSADVADVRWTPADVALLDDARDVLGPRPGRGGKIDDADEIRTFGHIVIDEVQDLTPMQLRMASRRSLNGSMTVVGDIAQATGALAPSSWDDVVRTSRRRRSADRRAEHRLSHPRPDHDARQQGDDGTTPGLRARPRCVEGTLRRSSPSIPRAR
jgi:hypothetical protein